jgi:hypothetical protein
VYKYIVLSFFILVISRAAMAASPIINQVNDQRVIQGEQYSYLPELVVATNAHWTKTYGPDDATVNPITGQVLWDIPANLPSESFHLGVKASNADGENEHTWIVTVGHGEVIYMGQNEDITTLKAGMAALSSGDTLVMKNGVYLPEGGNNTIPGPSKKSQYPEGGDETKFTTLMAEDPGKVIIDGQNTSRVINIFGSTKHPDHPASGSSFTGNTNYTAYKGLVLQNSDEESLKISYSHHIKLINMGIGASAKGKDGYANVYIYRSRFVLIEGMYVWGHGRYKIQYKDSTEGVVRRSVVRIDDYDGDEPLGAFISYCSKNIAFQNNILVDADQSNYWLDHYELTNAFGVAATNCYDYPAGNEFKRGLSLNTHMGLMKADVRHTAEKILWENLVGWDMKPDRQAGGTGGGVPLLSGVAVTDTNKVTIGDVLLDGGDGADFYMYSRSDNGPSLDSTVQNSIFYHLGWNGTKNEDRGDLIRNFTTEFTFTNNNLVDFTGDMAHQGSDLTQSSTMNIDPEYQYITMLPRDSLLRTMATDGGSMGAEIISLLGESGTFYGDVGYDVETDQPMWPFANESLAHDHMGAFTLVGTDRNGSTAGIKGARGFALEGQTLTNYVWGYLGSVVPPMNVTATSGNFQVKLMWNPSAPLEQAKLASYKIYQLVGDVKELKGEVTADILSYYVTGLSNDVSVDLAVTAVDVDGHESDYAYLVSSIPAVRSRPSPPILSVE